MDDEIERLRAALKRIRRGEGGPMKIAADALGGWSDKADKTEPGRFADEWAKCQVWGGGFAIVTVGLFLIFAFVSNKCSG